MRVLIIGASISGMLAAARWPDAEVLERGGPEDLAPVLGATFYAHEPVPFFAEAPLLVRTEVVGPGGSSEYAEKVYGDRRAPVSLDAFRPAVRAFRWDSRRLRGALENRVQFYSPVVRINLSRRVAVTPKGEVPYDALVVTSPLPSVLAMCSLPAPAAPFRNEPIWLHQTDASGGASVPDGEMLVKYFPDSEVPWYRSNQSGRKVEYEYTARRTPIFVAEAGTKLIPGKIWSHPESVACVQELEEHGVYCVGRYARWEQKWLSHQTWSQLQSMSL